MLKLHLKLDYVIIEILCKTVVQEIAKILSHPRVYAFLHVPVQSGSNQVLADMKREYSIEEFETVISFLRKK